MNWLISACNITISEYDSMNCHLASLTVVGLMADAEGRCYWALPRGRLHIILHLNAAVV